MGVYKQNGKWIMDYTYRGKRYRETFDSQEEAEIVLGKRREDIRLQRHPELRPAVELTLFDDHAQACWDNHFSLKRSARWTKGVIFGHLAPHFKGRAISGIRALDVQEYMTARLRAGAKPATVKGERAVLSKIMSLAVRWQKIESNPVEGAEPPEVLNKRDRTLTFEEATRLLNDPKMPEHLKLAVVVALETGARKGEVLSLRWQDVDLEAGVITFRQTNTKSGRERKVAVTDNLAAALREARSRAKVRQFDRASDYVVTFNGRPVRSVRTAFLKAIQRAKIAGLWFHDLRRTFAHLFVSNGGPAVAVQAYLGHADLSTTQRYLGDLNPLVAASAKYIGWKAQPGASATDLPRKPAAQ